LEARLRRPAFYDDGRLLLQASVVVFLVALAGGPVAILPGFHAVRWGDLRTALGGIAGFLVVTAIPVITKR